MQLTDLLPNANVVQQVSSDWATPQAITQANQSPHPSKRVAMSPSSAKPPVPAWEQAQPTKIALPTNQGQRGSVSRQNTGAPINLSLSEDERSPNRSSAELQSPQLGKSHPAVGQNLVSSPIDEADPLYEYFPLTVDDWMPPVDAVYRPHVVHHTTINPEAKAQKAQGKSKRYFAAE